MCGRVSLSMEWNRLSFILSQDFELDIPEHFPYTPHYNLAPSQPLLSVIRDKKEARNRLGYLHWNYYADPSKNTNKKNKPLTLINARSETIDAKPSFKDSFLYRPCLVVVDGFYEWEKTDKERIPHRFIPGNQSLFYIAGLYQATPSHLQKSKQAPPFGLCLLTTAANKQMKKIHHRMPALLPPDQAHLWLDTTLPPAYRKSILQPAPDQAMLSYIVSSCVNSVQCDDISCVQPLK